MANMASSIENKAGPHIGDTGWVDVAMLGSFQPQGAVPQVRRLGQVVYFKGGWSNAGMAATSAYDIGVVPVGFRPSGWKYGMVASHTAATAARTNVKTDGTIVLNTNAALGSYFMYDAFSYPLG